MLKKFYRKSLFILPALLLAGMGLQFLSCEKPDTKGIVKVVKFEDGTIVPGATVRMFIDSTDSDIGFFLCGDKVITPELIDITSSDGKLTTCFEEPALITVLVTFKDINDVVYVGEGKLNLEKHETTTITVKLIAAIP